jgi:elongation factor P--beta-lysine ligase
VPSVTSCPRCQVAAARNGFGGIALGLDRLVMLATGAARIDQVQWAPLPS